MLSWSSFKTSNILHRYIRSHTETQRSTEPSLTSSCRSWVVSSSAPCRLHTLARLEVVQLERGVAARASPSRPHTPYGICSSYTPAAVGSTVWWATPGRFGPQFKQSLCTVLHNSSELRLQLRRAEAEATGELRASSGRAQADFILTSMEVISGKSGWSSLPSRKRCSPGESVVCVCLGEGGG